MNVSVGKFFRKLIGRKQTAPAKVERKRRVQTEPVPDSGNRNHKSFYSYINALNNKQAQKAKRVKKSRKANKLARKQRKLNVKGGKR